MRNALKLLLFLVALSLAVLAQEVLTNDTVVKMVKAGLPESVVADMVRTRPGQYVLTSDKLIELKRAGVPASVLSAMIAKGTEAPVAKPQMGAPAEDQVAPTREWKLDDAYDKMTQERYVLASRIVGVKQGGNVEVTASCGRDERVNEIMDKMSAAPGQLFGAIAQSLGVPTDKLDASAKESTRTGQRLDDRFLSFQFRYLARPGSPVALRQSSVAPTLTPSGQLASTTVSEPKHCVYLRVMVDGRLEEDKPSEVCDTVNLASVAFTNLNQRDFNKRLLPQVDSPVGDMFGK